MFLLEHRPHQVQSRLPLEVLPQLVHPPVEQRVRGPHQAALGVPQAPVAVALRLVVLARPLLLHLSLLLFRV